MSGSAWPVAPALALGGASAFWGAQTGRLAPALAMAVALEGARHVRWRWEASDRDLERLADYTGLAFLVLAVYQFANRSVHAIYAILELMPYVLFPLILAQLYSARGTMYLSALVLSLRRRGPTAPHPDDREIDLGYPYALACLVSAATGEHPAWYLAGAGLLLAWLMWPLRPRRYRVRTWAGALACAGMVGFAAQIGVRELQQVVERAVLGLLGDVWWSDVDPDRTTTAIGTIGRLKLSDRVRVRVRSEDGPLPTPLLLREAAYDVFEFGNWRTSRTDRSAIDALPGTRTWPLAPEGPVPYRATLSVELEKEIGVIPLPYGARRMHAERGLEVQRNAYDTVTLEIPPGHIHYRVAFDPAAAGADPPTPADLSLPPSYAADFARLAGELGLAGRPPAEVAARVRRFFAEGFRYSLVQRGRWPGRMPLRSFLFEHRAGHCEYFATATALLLRAGGVPARYAVGYSLSEWSPLERRYVARARHAHSWAEAWIDGRWMVVDTTPALWAALEAEQVSRLQALLDLWTWLDYRIDRLRKGESGLERHYPWVLAALLALLAWRLSRRRWVARTPAGDGASRRHGGAAPDTGLGPLVAALEARGYQLRPGEPLGAWVRRLQSLHGDLPIAGELGPLLRLHYRLRFDPHGASEQERRALRERVAHCLAVIRDS